MWFFVDDLVRDSMEPALLQSMHIGAQLPQRRIVPVLACNLALALEEEGQRLLLVRVEGGRDFLGWKNTIV